MTSVPSPSTGPRQDLRLGILYRVLATICIAGSLACVKWAGSRGVPVFELVFFRNLCSFLPLAYYIWRTSGFSVLRTRRPLGHLARSAAGLGGMICLFNAYNHLPFTEVTAIQFSAPLFMTALSALVLHERVGRHRWAAVMVGFIGVLLMVRPAPGHFNGAGVALAMASALGGAGAMVAIRQMAATEKGSTIVFYFILTGALVGLVGSMLFGWVVPDLATLAVLVLSGVLGGIGQLLLTEALRLAPLGLVAPFDYTQLIWAALLGFLIWDEIPQPLTVLGAAVVVGSGLYILHREIRRFQPRG